MIVLVLPHDTGGVGFERRIECNKDGAEDFLWNMLKRIHPVC